MEEETKKIMNRERQVKSERVATWTGLQIIDKAILFIKQAGSLSEDSYERDGFLSYKSETHAAGAGIGIGFMIGASGRLSILGGILTLILYGNRGDITLGSYLLKDILSERPYFLGGIVLGVLLGIGARILIGIGIPDMMGVMNGRGFGG